MKRVLFALMCALALPALATEFGDRYPSGSIKDRTQADVALRDADAETTRIERESKAREADCYKDILVNRCREQVRRDRLTAEREVRRVRVEAHDLQRQLDARDAEKKRATQAGRASQPPAPTTREAPKSREISPEEAARNRAAYEKRIADKEKALADEKARAPERAENARAFRDKQAEAERRAKEKEAERKKNEERRAERRKQVEAQEAQREEVRRQAEAAAKAAGKQ